MSETIWNETARKLLYEGLVERFGPYSGWQNARTPGAGRDKEYREFLQTFAALVGAKSARAVEHQIAFALPVARISQWPYNMARHAILNMAAAFNAGLIVQSDLPDLIATRAEIRRRPQPQPILPMSFLIKGVSRDPQPFAYSVATRHQGQGRQNLGADRARQSARSSRLDVRPAVRRGVAEGR